MKSWQHKNINFRLRHLIHSMQYDLKIDLIWEQNVCQYKNSAVTEFNLILQSFPNQNFIYC